VFILLFSRLVLMAATAAPITTIVACGVSLLLLEGTVLQAHTSYGHRLRVDRHGGAPGELAVFSVADASSVAMMQVFRGVSFAVSSLVLRGTASFAVTSAAAAAGFFARDTIAMALYDAASSSVPSALATRLELSLHATETRFDPVDWEEECAYETVSLLGSTAGRVAGIYASVRLELPDAERGHAVRLLARAAPHAEVVGCSRTSRVRAWLVERNAEPLAPTRAPPPPPPRVRRVPWANAPAIARAAEIVAVEAWDVSSGGGGGISDVDTPTPEVRLAEVLSAFATRLFLLAEVKGYLRARDVDARRLITDSHPVLLRRVSRAPVAPPSWPHASRADDAPPHERDAIDDDETCVVCREKHAEFDVCSRCRSGTFCECCLDRFVMYTVVAATDTLGCPGCRGALSRPAPPPRTRH
jgi:hypothetical protein